MQIKEEWLQQQIDSVGRQTASETAAATGEMFNAVLEAGKRMGRAQGAHAILLQLQTMAEPPVPAAVSEAQPAEAEAPA